MQIKKPEWRNLMYLLTISLPLVVIDQITKSWAVSKLMGGSEVVVFDSWWSFIYVENKGAMWGLGATLPDSARRLIFLGFSTLVTLIVVYLLLAYAETKFMKVVYAFIIAGACGNLFDRYFRGFKVVDFINWHAGNAYHWPTFNFADAVIVVAVFMLAYEALIGEPMRRKNAKNGEKAQ